MKARYEVLGSVLAFGAAFFITRHLFGEANIEDDPAPQIITAHAAEISSAEAGAS